MSTDTPPPVTTPTAPGRGVRTPVQARAVDTRVRLLDAAVDAVRAHGYTALSVDALCRAAGVSKGAFFHHFASKAALAVEAVEHWSRTTGALFAGADFHTHADPLDRLLAYLDLRAALVEGRPIEGFTCVAGTLASETFLDHPDIRAACAASIVGHAATLEGDLRAAVDARSWAEPPPDPRDLALFTQAVLQGAFVLAKATNEPARVGAAVAHVRRYLEMLFAGAERHVPIPPVSAVR